MPGQFDCRLTLRRPCPGHQYSLQVVDEYFCSGSGSRYGQHVTISHRTNRRGLRHLADASMLTDYCVDNQPVARGHGERIGIALDIIVRSTTRTHTGHFPARHLFPVYRCTFERYLAPREEFPIEYALRQLHVIETDAYTLQILGRQSRVDRHVGRCAHLIVVGQMFVEIIGALREPVACGAELA